MNPITNYGTQNISASRAASIADKGAGIAVNAANMVKADPNGSSPVRSAIADLAKQDAPIDQNRVDAIREALSKGSYIIDSGKIADKMMEMDLGIAAKG